MFLQTALALAYGGAVLYNVLAVSKSPLNIPYTWHPIGVSGFIVFATIGIAQAQRIRGKLAGSRKTREPYVQLHGLFNWLALFSLIGAQAAIYISKERQNRPHLSTYHGVTGAATAGLFIMNVFGGGAMNTVPSLYKYIKYHRINGILVYALVLGAQGTAIWRGYVTKDEQMKTGLLALLASLLVVGFGKFLVRGKPAAGLKAD